MCSIVYRLEIDNTGAVHGTGFDEIKGAFVVRYGTLRRYGTNGGFKCKFVEEYKGIDQAGLQRAVSYVIGRGDTTMRGALQASRGPAGIVNMELELDSFRPKGFALMSSVLATNKMKGTGWESWLNATRTRAAKLKKSDELEMRSSFNWQNVISKQATNSNSFVSSRGFNFKRSSSHHDIQVDAIQKPMTFDERIKARVGARRYSARTHMGRRVTAQTRREIQIAEGAGRQSKKKGKAKKNKIAPA